MIEAFNRIMKAFGANRIEMDEADNSYIQFTISNWGSFIVTTDGEIQEWIADDYEFTARSKWLYGIGQGKTRNDVGELELL